MIQGQRKLAVALIIAISLFWAGRCDQQPSSNISYPTEIKFKERGVIVHGDATVSAIIPAPSELANIVEILIQEGNQFCGVQKREPQISKQTVISIEQDGPEVLNMQWNVQIMSTVLDEQGQAIYALLDNGSLIITKYSFSEDELTKSTKLYSFEGIGTVDTWLTEKHQLFYFNNTLFCLSNGDLKPIIIYKEGYWTISFETIVKNVASISTTPNFMYVMTLNELIAISKDNKQKTTLIKSEKFIDFAIQGDRYFILDEKTGLRIGQLSKSFSTNFTIVSIENVKKIKVHKSILFLIYEFQNRNYLAEYFVRESEITLNRYYYNYYSIKDIHITDSYAIINGYNEFILLRHSINRNSFHNLHQVEFLYKSHGVKVVDIPFISSQTNLQFMVTFKQKVQYIVVKSTNPYRQDGYAINNIFVSCKSDRPQSFIASITYKGTCSSPVYNSQAHYCTANVSNSMNFQFSHVKRLGQQNNTKFIFAIVLIIIIIFATLALIGVNSRISKFKEKLKNQQIARRNKIEQHSINMEQTFNADIQKQK